VTKTEVPGANEIDKQPSPAEQHEKKPWVKPSATIEQVTSATRTNLGVGGDAVTCHS
jgi:hypothetical protein